MMIYGVFFIGSLLDMREEGGERMGWSIVGDDETEGFSIVVLSSEMEVE